MRESDQRQKNTASRKRIPKRTVIKDKHNARLQKKRTDIEKKRQIKELELEEKRIEYEHKKQVAKLKKELDEVKSNKSSKSGPQSDEIEGKGADKGILSALKKIKKMKDET